MKLEIEIENIEACHEEVKLKGWTKDASGRKKGYSLLTFDGGIDIPKLGSVMVLDVTFRAPEPKFEPELVSSPAKL